MANMPRQIKGSSRLLVIEQYRRFDLERLCQARQVCHAEVVAPLLNVRDVRSLDPGCVGEIFLGPPACNAKVPDSLAELLQKGVAGRGRGRIVERGVGSVHGKSATHEVARPLVRRARLQVLPASARRALRSQSRAISLGRPPNTPPV